MIIYFYRLDYANRHLAKMVSPRRAEFVIHTYVTAIRRKVNGRAGRSGPNVQRLAASECVRGRENVSVQRVATVQDWTRRSARCPVANH